MAGEKQQPVALDRSDEIADAQQLAEARHEYALKLSRKIGALPREQWPEAAANWRRVALDIREVVICAERVVRERVRAARRRGTRAATRNLLREIAVHAVFKATGRPRRSALTLEDRRCIELAMEEVLEEIEEMLCAENDVSLAAVMLGARWAIALSAYAYRIGRQLDGDLIVGILATGKTIAPTHIAALALAELGMRPVEISIALEIADLAYVRRLIQPARVS